MEQKAYKIVLVGAGGVGKTALMKRLYTNRFEMRYVATLGVNVHSLQFPTEKGMIVFNVWDCAGQEQYSGLGDGYYCGADAAIIMYDSTCKLSLRAHDFYSHSISRLCSGLPVVTVGNKCELPERASIDGAIKVSVKTGENVNAPFLALAHALTGDAELQFQ